VVADWWHICDQVVAVGVCVKNWLFMLLCVILDVGGYMHIEHPLSLFAKKILSRCFADQRWASTDSEAQGAHE
jgi:hypothetical protein